MKGTIQSLTKQSGGGFNSNGEPIADVTLYSEPVECLYAANYNSNKGTYKDGKFTQSEFSVTIKDMTFRASEVLLKDMFGNELCQKIVQRLEVLDTINRVKIIV